MKMMNVIKRYAPKCSLKKYANLGVGGGLMMTAMSTYAALPESAKTSIESAKTDGLEAGWLVVGVFAALFVIKIVKRLL